MPETSVDTSVRPFVHDDLIHRLENGYAFAHDGVRDAAYALVGRRKQAAAHLAIGRLLAQGLCQKALEELSLKSPTSSIGVSAW